MPDVEDLRHRTSAGYQVMKNTLQIFEGIVEACIMAGSEHIQ